MSRSTLAGTAQSVSLALAGRLKRVSVNFGWDRLKCLGQLWLGPLKVSSIALARVA